MTNPLCNTSPSIEFPSTTLTAPLWLSPAFPHNSPKAVQIKADHSLLGKILTYTEHKAGRRTLVVLALHENS